MKCDKGKNNPLVVEWIHENMISFNYAWVTCENNYSLYNYG